MQHTQCNVISRLVNELSLVSSVLGKLPMLSVLESKPNYIQTPKRAFHDQPFIDHSHAIFQSKLNFDFLFFHVFLFFFSSSRSLSHLLLISHQFKIIPEWKTRRACHLVVISESIWPISTFSPWISITSKQNTWATIQDITI